jgi:hypothetical protein
VIRLPLWMYVAIAAFAACVSCLAFAGIQTHRLKAVKAEYAAFVAEVRAKGLEQERRTKEKTLTDQKLKESTDAQNAKLRSANVALSASLLNARASRGYLPQSSPGTGSPDTACFDRTLIERAIRELDVGVSGLLGEGDQAIIDRDTARDWVKAR